MGLCRNDTGIIQGIVGMGAWWFVRYWASEAWGLGFMCWLLRNGQEDGHYHFTGESYSDYCRPVLHFLLMTKLINIVEIEMLRWALTSLASANICGPDMLR